MSDRDITSIPDEYKIFVKSLVSPPVPKNEQQVNELHLVYGIIGEIIEFRNTWDGESPKKMEELFKEAGDILYYLTAYSDQVNIYIKMNPLLDDITQESFIKLFITVDKFMDLNKRKFFYNNPDPSLPIRIVNTFLELSDAITLIIHSFFSYRDVIDGNYKKLKARYGEGSFSIEASVARRDEREPKFEGF